MSYQGPTGNAGPQGSKGVPGKAGPAGAIGEPGNDGDNVSQWAWLPVKDILMYCVG